MKKGDIVAREIFFEQGEILATNFKSSQIAEEWRKNHAPHAEVQHVINDAGDYYDVITREVHRQTEEAEVQWVVDKDVALKFKDGSFKIIEIDKDPEWKVIKEAVPTYQSSVAQMSDEQLRASIDQLRQSRITLPKAPRVRGKPKEKSDPILTVLSKMDPTKKRELMKKLGMTDEETQ